MVVGSALQYQPQSQNQTPSFEEEALKRNTDCVYFLASPLTCKKGAECEYRHSDDARLNPRDCWYWLHSNCLNPKCAFRHPPLDGLLGNQVQASAGSSTSAQHLVAVGTSYAPNSAPKQGVPCVFFQKGHCLKGNWCSFLHIPTSSSSKCLLVKGPASSAEPTIAEPASSNFQKNVLDKQNLPAAAAKPIKNTLQEKATINAESASFSNEFATRSRTEVAAGVNDFHRYRSSQPVYSGNPVGLSGPIQESHLLYVPESMNGKDLEEVSREPSPGFDVLVDDEGRDSDYYTGEDRYGMSTEHEPKNEYDIGHSTDYNIIAAIGDERYQDSLGYNAHEQRKGQYGWEQRISGGSYYEKRPYGRVETSGHIDESDLRNRLMKHKKCNGLRSVISHEHGRDIEIRDDGYEGGHWGEQRSSLRDNSVSSRLRGRIGLSRRSVSPRSREHDKLASGSLQAKMRERIISEPFINGEKKYRGLYPRRDENNVDFAGPKSLAELKNRRERGWRQAHTEIEQSSFGKRKRDEGGTSMSFEGPKSLEDILKRKRGESNGDDGGGSKEEEKKEGGDGGKWEGELEREAEGYEHGEGELERESEGYEHGEGELEYDGEGGEEAYEGEDRDEEYGGGEVEEHDEEEFAKKMGLEY